MPCNHRNTHASLIQRRRTLELREHLQQFREILPVISVSMMALRRQDAESDTDIVHVLSQHACEPLDCEIERVESLLALHPWLRRQEGVHA
jgi:hypothetical protein